MKMSSKTLYIDGDGCNQYTRTLAERLGKRGVHVVIIANRHIMCMEETEMVVCPEGDNVADKYIAQHCENGDLVITRDLDLVSILLKQSAGNIYTISDNGELYSIDMIEARQVRAEQSKMRRQIDRTLYEEKHQTKNQNRKKTPQQKTNSKNNGVADYLEKWRLELL